MEIKQQRKLIRAPITAALKEDIPPVVPTLTPE